MLLDPNHDYTTSAGAATLAGHITDYWRRRGQSVRVYIEPVHMPRCSTPMFCVRSTMRGGRP